MTNIYGFVCGFLEPLRKNYVKVKIQATLTEGTPVDLKGVFIPPKVALSLCHIVLSKFHTRLVRPFVRWWTMFSPALMCMHVAPT